MDVRQLFFAPFCRASPGHRAGFDLNGCDLDEWLDRIHEGDCLALMRQLPDESEDPIVALPPYNLGNSTGRGVAVITPYRDCRGFTDNLPRAEYIAWQRACLAEMMRLLNPDGAIYYNHQNRVRRSGSVR